MALLRTAFRCMMLSSVRCKQGNARTYISCVSRLVIWFCYSFLGLVVRRNRIPPSMKPSFLRPSFPSSQHQIPQDCHIFLFLYFEQTSPDGMVSCSLLFFLSTLALPDIYPRHDWERTMVTGIVDLTAFSKVTLTEHGADIQAS